MSPTVLLRLEGMAVLIAAGIGYALLGTSWWVFVAFLLVPDVFMGGYLAGPRLGALVYNVGHTYVLPMGLGAVAWSMGSVLGGAVALIWIAHIGMDRALGYGLKQSSSFHDTHLSRAGVNPGAPARHGTAAAATSRLDTARPIPPAARRRSPAGPGSR